MNIESILTELLELRTRLGLINHRLLTGTEWAVWRDCDLKLMQLNESLKRRVDRVNSRKKGDTDGH